MLIRKYFTFIFLFFFGFNYTNASELINIKIDSGAFGDGNADDTSAISNAINSANDGDTIFFPPGTYKLGDMGAVIIDKNINLIGENAILDGVQGGSGAKFVLGDNLSDITIKGLHFKNFHTAIARQNTTYRYNDIQILQNKISDSNNGIVLGAKANRIVISENILKNITGSDSTSVIAISVGNYSDDTDLQDSSKIIISDNIIENVYNTNSNGNIATAIRVLARDVVITGNAIDKVNAVNTSSGQVDGLYIKAYGAIISNNHFRDAGANNYVKLKNGEEQGETQGKMGDYIISNNVFRTTSIPASENIIVIHADAVDINNNWFSNCSSNESAIAAKNWPITMVRIRNNSFRNCAVPSYIKVVNSNHEITGNSFFNIVGKNLGSATSAISLTTISEVNPLKNITIEFNRFYFDAQLSSGTQYHYGISTYIDGENTDGIFIRDNEFFGYNHQSIGPTPSTIRAFNFVRNSGDTTSSHKNYDISSNTIHGTWRDTDTYLRMNYELDTIGIAVIDNRPAGGQVNLIENTVLDKGESGVTISNDGASGTVTMTLPAAERGLVFRGVNVASADLRFDPVDNESILGGNGDGKFISLETGASIELKCVISGKWNITSQSGAIKFEDL